MRQLGDAPAEYFVICTGESRRKVQSISDKVQESMVNEASSEPMNLEGKESSTWVLIDYFNVVVHIFHPKGREFYQLDELWGDAEVRNYENKSGDELSV